MISTGVTDEQELFKCQSMYNLADTIYILVITQEHTNDFVKGFICTLCSLFVRRVTNETLVCAKLPPGAHAFLWIIHLYHRSFVQRITHSKVFWVIATTVLVNAFSVQSSGLTHTKGELEHMSTIISGV